MCIRDSHGVDGALAHAVVRFGHGEGREAQLGQFAPGGAVKTAGGHGSAAALKRVALVHPLAPVSYTHLDGYKRQPPPFRH